MPGQHGPQGEREGGHLQLPRHGGQPGKLQWREKIDPHEVCVPTCVFLCDRRQVFSYTANKEIRTDDLCLDVSRLNGPVMMLKCHHLKGNQLWDYDPVVSHSLTLTHTNATHTVHCFALFLELQGCLFVPRPECGSTSPLKAQRMKHSR